jgi:DNA polymerase-3 subunit beta
MQIKLAREALSRAVAEVWHIADRRSTMRILSCVLFEASEKDERLKLASSNIRNTIQYDLGVDSDSDGGFAVPAKTLSDVVRILPDPDVSIASEDDDKILITSGSYNARVPVLPREEFPTLPVIDETSDSVFTLSSAKLKRLIERTAFSISDDETRPYLNGALFQSTGDYVKMVTTDGHRMTIHGEPLSDDEKASEIKLLVPQLGIQELKRFLDVGSDSTTMIVDGSNVHFTKDLGDDGSEHIVLTVRLTESEFPPYESVIPRSNDKSVICNRAHLLDAIRRVSVMTSERHRAVHMRLVGDDINVRADNPELGEAEENVPVAYEGENLVIGFNANYVVNVLNAMDADQVEMKFGSGLDGAIFKVPESEDFLGIVMPIRI